MLRACFVLLVLFLSGCSGTAPAGEEAAEFEGIVVDGEGGIIRGIVVDVAVVPVAGAEVAIDGGPSARTNEKGAFAFGGLEPGLYVVHVNKTGFYGTTVTVALTSEEPEPPTLKVVLEPDISTTAYVQTVRVQGFLECGIGIPAAGSWSVCQAPVGVFEILCKGADPVPPPGVCIPPVNRHQGVIEVPLERVPTYAQAEAIWDPTSVGAEVLTWGSYVREPDTTQFENGTSVTGPSPVVMPWSSQNLSLWDVGGQRIMVYQVFPESGGIGNLVLEQEVEVFVTTFYRFHPEAGWQFSIHGEPSPP